MDIADNIPGSERPAVASIVRLQWITIAWMGVELLIAGLAGIRACSVALTAFAGDSAIELLSAIVVLHRFHIGIAAEKSAARMTAVLLYLLAAYILVSSAIVLLSHRIQPQPSYLGIALLLAAAIIMPLLGRAKKRLAIETGSKALKADATQSSVCAYLSWIALAGVGVNDI
jgi:divalent metal cation (Fe/Co/Zn/Cd) transporter